MRALFVAPGTPGLLAPTFELGSALVRRGHECALLTEPAALQTPGIHEGWRNAGMQYLQPPTNRPAGLRIDMWSQMPAMAAQALYLQKALREFQPDLVVGQLFTLGCQAMCARAELPLVVLAGACWPFPLPNARPLDRAGSQVWDRLKPEMRWRHRQFVNAINDARLLLQLPPLTLQEEETAVMGDLCLLRSAPALERRDPLPPRLRYTGTMLPHGLVARPSAAMDWLEDPARQGDVIYVQQGRTFGSAGFLRPVLDAAGALGLRVLLDPLRMDASEPALPPHAFMLRQPPSPDLLARCSAVVTTGHPTSVLAALEQGLPMLLFPTGSGSDDLAARCVLSGAAVSMDPARATAGDVSEALRGLLGDVRHRERAGGLRASLARSDDATSTAAYLEGWLERRRVPVLDDAPALQVGA